MSGCFSPYMVISSALEFVFGKERREEQERTQRLNQDFQEWMTKRKNDFEDDLNILKIQWMREKLQFQKTAIAKEKYAKKELNSAAAEVQLLLSKEYLPIDEKNLLSLYETAESYMKKGYTQDCPINIVLFHTVQEKIDYEVINKEITKREFSIGNIVFQRWCNSNVAHNAAILNLHAIMANIPTLVISPFFFRGDLHFDVAFWEVQADASPLIRRALSFKCDCKSIATEEDKNILQKQIGYISTIITGCARDSYMLFSYGMPPTLPRLLKDKENKDLLEFIQKEECKELRQFVLNEYSYISKKLLEMDTKDPEVMRLLANQTEEANNEIKKIIATSILENKKV